VALAVRTLAPLACATYVDMGHGGWMSYERNLLGLLDLIREMNIWGLLRGFATNVANYQPLGDAVCDSSLFQQGTKPAALRRACTNGGTSCCSDPCGVLRSWGWGNSELHYALILANTARAIIPGFEPHIVIDTSRNGVAVSNCAAWCNVRHAALGHAPTTDTMLPDVVDAYLWIKPPGESDGCSSPRCHSFDASCRSRDSLGGNARAPGESDAPEAGELFPYQLVQLARAAIGTWPPPLVPAPPLSPPPMLPSVSNPMTVSTQGHHYQAPNSSAPSSRVTSIRLWLVLLPPLILTLLAVAFLRLIASLIATRRSRSGALRIATALGVCDGEMMLSGQGSRSWRSIQWLTNPRSNFHPVSHRISWLFSRPYVDAGRKVSGNHGDVDGISALEGEL